MTGFHQVRVGDVLTFQRGFDITKSEQSDGDVPIVSSSGVSSFHNKWKARGPGVVIGRKGTLGTVHFLRSDYWPHDTTLWVKDFKGNEPRFLSYFLQTLKLENFDVGASNPTLNRNHVHKIKIIFPKKIDTQQRIAAILSAYDDFIENNKRRIALLEKLAEEIFREWFVRFRFPGHEKAKFIRSMPCGWPVKKLGELVRTQYGYTASAETEGEGPKFLRITDIVPYAIDWERVPHCKIEEKDEEKYLLQEGDIVVARTGATFGYAKRINKRHPKAVFASYLVRLIPKRTSDAIFLGLSIERSTFKDFIWMFDTGAAQPQANATTMALFPVLYPPEPLLTEFNRIVEPILDEKELLLDQAATLSRTRDFLLSRLISGKLSVENLDIQFPPGMIEELKPEQMATADA
jgi:type I restriction enzyme, S subunit